MVDAYVPFRNGLLLSVAAVIAVSVHPEVIYYRAHADDTAGRAYPGCTPGLKDAMNLAIHEGLDRTLRIEAPFIHMNKTQVIETGLRLNAPYQFTRSCYKGSSKPCGECYFYTNFFRKRVDFIIVIVYTNNKVRRLDYDTRFRVFREKLQKQASISYTHV